MKKTLISSTLAAMLFTSCASISNDPTKVEHIEVPYPFPESGWIHSVKNEGNREFRRWHKEDETFMVTITRKPPTRDIESLRNGLDHQTKIRFPKNFISKTIVRDKVGLADRLIWSTEVQLSDGSKNYTILNYMRGNDASYIATKQWSTRSEYNAESEKWLAYLKTIRISDPRL